MNILVPDSWLREFLITKATPQQIKEYLSLCGPSVERIHTEDGEVIYDIEVTGNRPDSMSILGIAREASVILPRFGIEAKLLNNPYDIKLSVESYQPSAEKKLNITTDSKLNPRWTSVVIDNIKVAESPTWLQKRLVSTGIRSLNTIVDVTNYIMRAYGQPVHAFDYDQVLPKDGVPTMILRASTKGERVITLDGKTHILPGDDIVIEDGSGRLIDLCGIMGAQNSSIKSSTKAIVLFMQTYEPTNIRKTSMTLAHRTEAAGLFEKGLDTELVLPSILKGIELITQVAGGKIASKIYDFYSMPHKPYIVSVTKEKMTTYLGISLPDKEVTNILTPLGFNPIISKSTISAQIPSFRRDVTIDVDIIEEVARIYGYHNIKPKLPSTEPPIVIPDPALRWEEEIKVRLRDWGYMELYTYSMISEEFMDFYKLDKMKTYKITNPLSNEWVYMRPSLCPSMLTSIAANIAITQSMALFELSHIYVSGKNELPEEKPKLLVSLTGKNKFKDLKGLSEVLFTLFGIPYPLGSNKSSNEYTEGNKTLSLGDYGYIGEVKQDILSLLSIGTPVTVLELDIQSFLKNMNTTGRYIPIPKYPPSFEDLAFIVQTKTRVGDLLSTLKSLDPLISDVSLLDSFENTRTLHVTYLSTEKNLTSEDVRPVREKILAKALKDFGASLKS
jgi:phenylalanyl-tRNA synthetase beta chain